MATAQPVMTLGGGTASECCFVIAESNERTDVVLERIIRPACGRTNLNPVLSFNVAGPVWKGIANLLQTAPMCIAFLGNDKDDCWNANVMIELGIRLASGLPVVMLCDVLTGNNLKLPFDIAGQQVIKILPDCEESASQALRKMLENRGSLGRSLRSEHACAVITAPTSVEQLANANNWKYLVASKRAEEMFGKLSGFSLEDFYGRCKNIMCRRDYDAFVAEQRLLIRAVVDAFCSPNGRRDEPVAKTPIVVSRHESNHFNRHAFLPIIVNIDPLDELLQLHVLYLDVTGVVEPHVLNGDLQRFECRISPISEPLESRWFPLAARPGVFLSHNSKDKPLVRKVFDLFMEVLEVHEDAWPWLDVESIPAGSRFVESIEDAIKTCRTAMVFLGEAPGEWQKDEIIKLKERSKDRDFRIVVVKLPSFQGSVPLPLSQWETAEYAEVATQEWVGSFVENYILG
jgi:hypothetical protein